MTVQPREIPFSTFLYASLIGNVAYGIPTIGAFLLFDIVQVKLLLVVILIYSVVAMPLGTALAWLIAKGSNWVHSSGAMVLAFAASATLYGLAGGWLCYRLFGIPVGAVGAIVLLIAAQVTRIPVGNFITRRFLSPAQPARI